MVSQNLVALFLAASLTSTAEGLASQSEDQPSQAALFSEERCLEWGFDPSQLSCDTCKLLVESTTTETVMDTSSLENTFSAFFEECKICCQKWRKSDAKDSLGRLYRSAVIVTTSRSLSGEMKEFLDGDDFKDIVKKKESGAIQVQMGPPMQLPLLLFYENAGAEHQKEPDEMVMLSKWKKEDIRDLLANSLPDAVASEA